MTDKRTSIYVHDVKDLPEEKHYAVLVNESITYDDGYGVQGRPSNSTKSFLEYIAFSNEEALKEWILAQHTSTYGRKTYKVIVADTVQIELQTSISIKL